MTIMALPILIPATEIWAAPRTAGASFTPPPEKRTGSKPRRRLHLEDHLPRGRKFWPSRQPKRVETRGAGFSAGNTLELCEQVAIANLRRWARELRCNGRHVYAIARSCDASLRVLVSVLDREAMAWMLLAMYWKGFSHPMSLIVSPLHPPTGVHRWLMASSERTVFDGPVHDSDRLVRVMRAYRARAVALSALLLKREVLQGRVRLRPELLRDEFWKS